MNSLFKSLFMIVPMSLSMVTYFKFDKEYLITDKISYKINVDKKWKPCVVISCYFLFMLILGIIGIYVIDISDNLYSIMSGLVLGVSLGFVNKLSNQNKNI
ncbi:hypothetical protein CLVI_16170 [Clostridium vincentii]|uniref:Uncharacterized protein n=1 Tax=Clostridium vincentii TaxID=52704 RepID=A0A2T0BFI1_9CLOT|nr:hypothetical protein CLVI_16170 [Clostridium vincentii]